MQGDKRKPCLDSTVLNPHTTACSDECAYYPERAGTHTFWDEVLLLVRLGEGFLYCRGGGGLAPVPDVSSLEEWYRYKRMRFGPMNAPAYFTQLMQQVLDHNYSDCAIHHVDDLLGFAPHFLG